MRSIFKYSDLIAGTVASVGAIVIFIFFMDLNIDPTKSHRVYITIRSEYASWAWFAYSLSLALYYFARSKGKTTSGGYINPIFNLILKSMTIIPVIGLMLSLFSGTKSIIESRAWNNIIVVSSNFLDSIFVLFVFALFGAGINIIKSFFNKRHYNFENRQ